MKRCLPSSEVFLLCCLMTVAQSFAAPVLHDSPFYQSPVHAGPDDLLLLPGSGFAIDDVVVYRRIEHSDAGRPPLSVPASNSAERGTASIISNKHVPYSLTIRLPDEWATDSAYALWVRDATGAWSNPVLVNDIRPLWFSPSYVYATSPLADMSRYLKVIGRNLRSAPDTVTQIRLNGPQRFQLDAHKTEAVAGDDYIAEVTLPKRLAPGRYTVEASRDGRYWVPVADQTLEVRQDQATLKEFSPGTAAFGSCKPDDNRDDSSCLQKAFAAAAISGGVVTLQAGQWDLIDPSSLGNAASHGLRLPKHVSLRGVDKATTRLVRHQSWNTDRLAALVLSADTRISNLTFADLQRYTSIDQAGPFIQLGFDTAGTLTEVSNIIIDNNVFDRVMIAIADSGAPIRNLIVTHNEFGAYHEALHLSGNRFRLDTRFGIQDAVITHNIFHPGSWLDTSNRQGAIASELGAGLRVDFSHNIADGASTRFLNSVNDARGWRAGFFWHMNGNQEQLLISANTLSCTGDKAGDGEAIALDNNGNTFAVDAATSVSSATSNSITINGGLLARQYDRPVTDRYYIGHWIQIGEGPGLGQVRKITAVNRNGNTVTLSVSPHWDIIPTQNSRISIGREFWQTYVLDNVIEHRQPLCQKSNRNDTKGGGISLFAQLADSTVAGNRQFDSNGILLQTQFTARGRCKDCYRGTFFNSFIDIHHNQIEGEYDWNRDCSASGIFNSLAATPDAVPLTTSYGLNIAHNTIHHADAWQGGAIAMTPSWYQGPAPQRWPLVEGALIQHNDIDDMWSAPATSCGQKTAQRTGINLNASSLVMRSVLYANTCNSVPQPISIKNTLQTTAVCKPQLQNSCECSTESTKAEGITPTKVMP